MSASAEALQTWAQDLRQQHPDARVAICFEQPANNLIAFLTRYDWIIHEWAAESRLWIGWAKAFYAIKRAAGMSHHTAVRSLAYTCLRVLWRCWQDSLVYEKAIYIAALKNAGGPIIAWMEQHAQTADAYKNSLHESKAASPKHS